MTSSSSSLNWTPSTASSTLPTPLNIGVGLCLALGVGVGLGHHFASRTATKAAAQTQGDGARSPPQPAAASATAATAGGATAAAASTAAATAGVARGGGDEVVATTTWSRKPVARPSGDSDSGDGSGGGGGGGGSDNKDFLTVVGPEGHALLLEPGKGGRAIAPMQALLGAAATCFGVGVLDKVVDLLRGLHGLTQVKVDVLEVRSVGMRGAVEGISKSVFTTIALECTVAVDFGDTPEEVLDTRRLQVGEVVAAVVEGHRCSVLCNLSGVTEVRTTSAVVRSGGVGT